ncbi:MAG: hypothetical protein M1838_000918 [Thelocarpon superellum]|nr:MAG: hypothetical protein M1838_000918 [Thelocarpon superellum]
MDSRDSTNVVDIASAEDYSTGLMGVNVSLDYLLTNAVWFSLVALCLAILLARWLQMGVAHVRHLFSLTATHDQQRYWMRDHTTIWPRLKEHLLYAPLWKKRHNREMQLSSAINMGTLPSRLHTILLLLYIFSNVAYTLILDYRGQTKSALIAEVRGRAGVLAVVNMIPLFILAGRNNPLIKMLRVSFDTYNLLHRWMGRIVVLEAIVHMFAWGANQVSADGWSSIGAAISGRPSFQYGSVGVTAMMIILIQSPSAIRHAFYETFLHIHQAMALAAVIGVYFHLDLDHLPQLPYIKAVIAIWALDRSIRFLRVWYRCFSWQKGWTTVKVQVLPGEACRVSFEMRRPWTFRPGCHAFVYLPSISLHQSHPFSVAWSDERPASPTAQELEKLPRTRSDLLPISSSSSSSSSSTTIPSSLGRTNTTVSLVIHKRTGMTATLYNRALASPNQTLTLRGALEGPYGGLESLHSYGTVMLFAGGIGITHQVSHVRDLVSSHSQGLIATRKVILVWTVRATEHLEWVRPWMDIILAMPGRRALLKILLFVTKPRSAREIISPSATVQMYPGRPQPEVLLDKEIEARTGAMAVTVCGPGSLADSVRDAVRRRVDVASLDFVEESFTW